MGEVIDAYAPASGTLGATNSTTSGFLRPDIENYIEKYSGGITTSSPVLRIGLLHIQVYGMRIEPL